MNVKIYQAKGNCPWLFQGHSHACDYEGRIDESQYVQVYSGDVKAKDLEDVYNIFNCMPPEHYYGRSLSVSDVVVAEGCSFYVNPIGFERITFDTSVALVPETTANEIENRYFSATSIYEFDKENSIGERIEVFFNRILDNGKQDYLPRLLYKAKQIPNELNSYWQVRVFVTNKEGICFAKYNPIQQGKTVDYSKLVEATEENKMQLLKEIKGLAFDQVALDGFRVAGRSTYTREEAIEAYRKYAEYIYREFPEGKYNEDLFKEASKLSNYFDLDWGEIQSIDRSIQNELMNQDKSYFPLFTGRPIEEADVEDIDWDEIPPLDDIEDSSGNTNI